MDKVLIVDDDNAVLNILYKVIVSNGIEADTASGGEEALKKILSVKYDLILLDINLGNVSGFEVLQKIRDDGISTPVVIVSARNEDYDTLYGLNIGADDYITKPFNPVILGAKVKALIRRSRDTNGKSAENNLVAGPFVYDVSMLRLYKSGKEVLLTSKENSLMKLFLDNVNRIFSKDMIYEMVWGEYIVDENAVMVYINRLRQKIEDDPSHPKYIQNVRGLGYRFVV